MLNIDVTQETGAWFSTTPLPPSTVPSFAAPDPTSPASAAPASLFLQGTVYAWYDQLDRNLEGAGKSAFNFPFAQQRLILSNLAQRFSRLSSVISPRQRPLTQAPYSRWLQRRSPSTLAATWERRSTGDVTTGESRVRTIVSRRYLLLFPLLC
jgi:hypothetical protein